MTAREKIIVVATGVVVSWGGVAYFQPLLSPATESDDPVVAAADDAFVARSRQQVDAARLTDAERYVLNTATSTWHPRPPAVRKTLQTDSAKPNRKLAFDYSGFVNMGGECFAIINGHEYRRGDALQDGAGIVEGIAADHVVLLLENGSKREVVPFQKPAMKGE